MGDITNNNTPIQWERAQASLKLLNGIVPYVLTIGNHDMVTGSGGTPNQRGQTMLNQYFNPTDFPGLAGTYQKERLENSYYIYKIGGVEYLVISLEFAPPDEVLEWANQVIEEYPSHRVIFISHSYMASDGSPERRDTTVAISGLKANRSTTVNEGIDVWEKLLKNHDNVFMALSGHTPVSTIPHRTSVGVHGNRVYELLVDYQNEPNGGNGWLALLEFHPDGNITVSAYSPYLNEYKKTVDKYGYNSSFVIDTENGSFKTSLPQ